MRTRREFIKQTAAAGIAGGTAIRTALAAGAASTATRKANKAGDRAPLRIKSVLRREETTLRLGGDGDNFHMSWRADDRQVVAVCDGTGWLKNPRNLFNNRLFTITGGPQNARFEDIPAYPDEPIWGSKIAYHGFGTFALDGSIYQFASNMFRGVKLIYSPDNGRTWRNQDGSTPVVWESKDRQSRDSMIFFEEPQEAFMLLSVLQMGRNYEFNRDGYVYIYAPNGTTEGTMNELVLCRMPKTQIRDRHAYEYFGGSTAGGGAKWVKDINERAAVHTFPRGWVNKTLHPYAWHPSITYNGPLGLYLMANWGMGCTPDGEWFGKPSYLGFWVAANPWGPWIQVHEDTAWTPGNDPKARAYQPQIAPKWISKDGKSFWLVWTDFQHTEKFWPTLREAGLAKSAKEYVQILARSQAYRPYYAFNVQRVDLIVG
jgi:hypothetical protein